MRPRMSPAACRQAHTLTGCWAWHDGRHAPVTGEPAHLIKKHPDPGGLTSAGWACRQDPDPLIVHGVGSAKPVPVTAAGSPFLTRPSTNCRVGRRAPGITVYRPALPPPCLVPRNRVRPRTGRIRPPTGSAHGCNHPCEFDACRTSFLTASVLAGRSRPSCLGRRLMYRHPAALFRRPLFCRGLACRTVRIATALLRRAEIPPPVPGILRWNRRQAAFPPPPPSGRPHRLPPVLLYRAYLPERIPGVRMPYRYAALQPDPSACMVCRAGGRRLVCNPDRYKRARCPTSFAVRRPCRGPDTACPVSVSAACTIFSIITA